MFSDNMVYYKGQLETENDFSCAVPSVFQGWLCETQKYEALLWCAEERS